MAEEVISLDDKIQEVIEGNPVIFFHPFRASPSCRIIPMVRYRLAKGWDYTCAI